MARPCNLIRDLNVTMATQWRLKIRVVRLWEVVDRDNPRNVSSIEMLWMDQTGEYIHATVGRYFVNRFRHKFKELGLFYVQNFGICINTMKFRNKCQKLKVNFTPRTTVDETNDANFSWSIFKFRPYQQLINGQSLDEEELFDVIGKVDVCETVQSVNKFGDTKRLINIHLLDDEGNKIPSTFFGDFVDQIVPILQVSKSEPVVVVLQLVKAHKYQDKYSVRNTYHISKLWINSELPQVQDFKSSITKLGDSSQGITQISTQTPPSIADEILSENGVKSVAYLLSCYQEGNIWIVASIEDILLDNGWSYPACVSCAKAIKVENNYHCTKCGKENSSPTLRYRIKVKVKDANNSVPLLLWDREASNILGKTAKELQDGLPKDSSDGVYSYPEELNSIMGKMFLFKVVVKSSNIYEGEHVYTVLKLSEDEDLLMPYRNSKAQDKSNDMLFNTDQVVEGDNENTDSTEDLDLPTEMPSSLSPQAMNTSGKRAATETEECSLIDDDDPIAKLSCTKSKRKVKKSNN